MDNEEQHQANHGEKVHEARRFESAQGRRQILKLDRFPNSETRNGGKDRHQHDANIDQALDGVVAAGNMRQAALRCETKIAPCKPRGDRKEIGRK